MELNHQVSAQLKHLRLSGVVETLAARSARRLTPNGAISTFCRACGADEIERRAQKQLSARAPILVNTTKTLEGFDFSINPSINRQQILAQWRLSAAEAQCADLWSEWVGVVSAQALGHEACRQGYDVVFITTHVAAAQRRPGRWQRPAALETYLAPSADSDDLACVR